MNYDNLAIAFEIKHVTPDMASSMFARSDAAAALDPTRKQRNIRRSWANNLAKDNAAGAFILTHQPIAVGPSGFIYDGQHRLKMIQMSGSSAWLAVATYMSETHARAAMSAFDSGVLRTLGDRLELSGLLNERGQDTVAIARGVHLLLTADGTPSNGTTTEAVSEYLDAIKAVRAVLPAQVGPRRYSAMAASAFVLAQHHEMPVIRIADRIASNTGLSVTEARISDTIATPCPGGSTMRLAVALRLLRLLEAVCDGEEISRAQVPDREAILSRVMSWKRRADIKR